MDIIEEYFEEKKKAEALGIKTNDIIGHGGWDWGHGTGWKQPPNWKPSETTTQGGTDERKA